MIDDDCADRGELAAWLRLTLTPGVGPVAVRRLLAAFGLPQQALGQTARALSAVIGARSAHALLAPDAERERAVARALDWAEAPGQRLLTLADAHYPAALLHTPDPPAVLYVQGDVRRLSQPAVAIVGSRNATAGGRDTATRMARALAEAGLCVVSGLARGIDAAAHAGALDTAAGTVAVMATGMDRIYPPEHARLAARIVGCGALVTEAPPGTGSHPSRFPRRNRIIAALSRGVLVVEAARASGSLITARIAGEIGREVLAVPGSIHSPLSKGCHWLIQQGAKLVESAEDVLVELDRTPAGTGRPAAPADAGPAAPPARLQADPQARLPEPPEPPDPEEVAVLVALGFDPVHPDELAGRAGLADGALAARLLLLELAGRIERLPDGRCLRRLP